MGVFVAIISHKFFAAMAFGSTVRNADWSPRLSALCFVLFSAATPTGVGIGLELHSTSDYAIAVLQSLAAGAFLYLGGWHLIRHALDELSTPFSTRLGFLFFLIGFGIMSALGIWT